MTSSYYWKTSKRQGGSRAQPRLRQPQGTCVCWQLVKGCDFQMTEQDNDQMVTMIQQNVPSGSGRHFLWLQNKPYHVGLGVIFKYCSVTYPNLSCSHRKLPLPPYGIPHFTQFFYAWPVWTNGKTQLQSPTRPGKFQDNATATLSHFILCTFVMLLEKFSHLPQRKL